MNARRKLVLRKENLSELTGREMQSVAGGDNWSGQCPTFETCVTCVDTLTIATCMCPTGPSCVCPTEYGCA